MPRSFSLALGLFLALMLSLTSPAGATAPSQLPPGVHLDPGSPAGKEYAMPLGQGRGGSGSRLFGAGITKVPPTGGGGNAGGTSGGGAGGASSGGGAGGRARGAARVDGANASRGGPGRSESGVDTAAARARLLSARSQHQAESEQSSPAWSGIAWMLGSAILVLGLGSAAAAAINRVARNKMRPNG